MTFLSAQWPGLVVCIFCVVPLAFLAATAKPPTVVQSTELPVACPDRCSADDCNARADEFCAQTSGAEFHAMTWCSK